MATPSAESIQKAEELKVKGNDEFKVGNYDKAIDFYTQALQENYNAVILANRSLAYIKQEKWALACKSNIIARPSHPHPSPFQTSTPTRACARCPTT